MKIYFAGSIRGGRDDKELYFQIIKQLSQYGTVLTEHIGDQSLSDAGEEGPAVEYIYERDMKWLQESDVLVAEVTKPSLGVGYEVAKAESMNKKVICVFREDSDRKLSAMIAGSRQLIVARYRTTEELEKVFADNIK